MSLVSALGDLSWLSEDPRLTSAMTDQIQILEYELFSLGLFVFCLTNLIDSSSFGKNKEYSGFTKISRVGAALEKNGLQETGVLALESGEFEGWDTLSAELLESIRICKLAIEEDVFHFFDSLSRCEFSRDELESLMSYISVYLYNFLNLKGDLISDKKVKIESLKEDLDIVKGVLRFTMKRCNSDDEESLKENQCESDEETEEMKSWEGDEESYSDKDAADGMENYNRNEEIENFKIQVQAWTCNAACFCLLNWVQGEREENVATASIVNLSDLLQKLNTALPEVTRMCLAVLKASKPSEDERLQVGTLVSKFVDFLLRKLQADMPAEDIQMLRNGMLFLITFLMDPPKSEKYSNDGNLILTQAAVAVNEAAASLITSQSAGNIEEAIAEKRNSLLQEFLGKFNIIKAEVRKLYAPLFPDSSSFNFPKINVLGVFDSIIEKLEETSISYSMHQIVKVQEELVSLRNLLKLSSLIECFILELQDERNELKDLWTRIVNVAYQTERTINSFLYLKTFVWLDLLCLFDVTEEIQHIITEVKRIKDHHHVHDIDALNTERNLSLGAPLQTDVQTMDEVVVGFQAEVEEILDWLRSGPGELDILSIIGMAGMGKTTLAKKVYRNPSIKCHFIKCAWCTVSQSYNGKKILLDILHDVTEVNDSFSKLEEEDLADKLRKCLKGRKYLIVMDDIWDVGAWNSLKLSFPNDNNGSRIIFTSRIYNVVLEAKLDSCPYPLSPLSKEESWELLEKRLFHKNNCPSNFDEVGKQIAKGCKGLPLAVVLVAGVLKERIDDLDWWKQIGEGLASSISKDGCEHILEQSYRHLPEHLKPCFLYFGSFREDKVIRAKKLVQLWVSEGFIRKQEMKTLENVAEEYLMDLVARSLVIVAERSARGGIKTCQVHDLLWEFCLAKAEGENFFKVLRGEDNSQVSHKDLNKHYRLCIQSEDWSSFLMWTSSALHSLLFSPAGPFSPFDTYTCYFSNAKFLQVLDLEDVMFLKGFPENMTKLVLLRYIAIHMSFATSVPLAIWDLERLETLRVSKLPYEFRLPNSIWVMKKLRHVDVGPCIPPYLNDYMPELENIQSFSYLCLTYKEETKRFLRKIPSVRKLKCEFKPIGEKNQKLELDFLNHLESLNMTCAWRDSGSCPFSFPSSMKKLTLKYFGIPWAEISTIAKLPNLEVLKLLNGAFIGKAWNTGDDEFLKLKFLKLKGLKIEQWDASDESFPCLEQLIVGGCRKLEEIPSAFGNIPTLKMIQVERCCSTVGRSAQQIQEAQIELGNEDLKVLIRRSFRRD